MGWNDSEIIDKNQKVVLHRNSQAISIKFGTNSKKTQTVSFRPPTWNYSEIINKNREKCQKNFKPFALILI